MRLLPPTIKTKTGKWNLPSKIHCRGACVDVTSRANGHSLRTLIHDRPQISKVVINDVRPDRVGRFID
jgi:hypothetical protein